MITLLTIGIIFLLIYLIYTYKESIFRFAKKYFIHILFIIGIVSLSVNYTVKILISSGEILYLKEKYKIISELVGDIGHMCLVSSLFASVLKSIQFLGIFKEEIEKIVTSEEFLGNQNNLKEIWKNATRALYKTDFPEISDKIETIISNKYLPKEELKNYFENFHVHINIELNESENTIELIEETHFQVKMSSKEDAFCHKIEYFVLKSTQDDEFTMIDLIDFNVRSFQNNENGKILGDKPMPVIIREPDNLIQKYVYEVNYKGSTEYTASRSLKFKFYLDTDNQHHHISKLFVNNMLVQIRTSANLDVDFYPIGTDEFETVFSKAGELTKRHDGLLFPGQGYRIIFNRK